MTIVLNGTQATASGTITVAATTSYYSPTHTGTLFAMLTPFGLLGLAAGLRRRGLDWKRVAVFTVLCAAPLAVAAGAAGCSSSASAGGMRPSGSQVVTFTASANGITQSVAVTVNIQ
jgi:hypothetical protein